MCWHHDTRIVHLQQCYVCFSEKVALESKFIDQGISLFQVLASAASDQPVCDNEGNALPDVPAVKMSLSEIWPENK